MASVLTDMAEADFLAECARWDEAFLAHFVRSAPRGEPLFLSVHEGIINRLGQDLGRTFDDFLALVRRRWVRSIQRAGRRPRKEVVVAHRLRRPSDVQGYVTFLAAMVLAAQWMETELRETAGAAPLHIDEKNYFKRLREVLDLALEDEQVRPHGLRNYEDAILWRNWSDWIEEGGWRSTAHPGRGARVHINYPLSQTLLRDGDRAWIARRFWEEVSHGSLSRTHDQEMLLGWMLAHRARFPRPRLWHILDHPEHRLRYEATEAAIFEVYSAVDWDAELEEDESQPRERSVRRLTAGLYREEDIFCGEVSYSIYLRQPKVQAGSLTVAWMGVEAPLRTERPGWFMPLPWGPTPPAKGLTLKIVTSGSAIREVVFPERDFWLLVSDPLAGGTGALASWDVPPMPGQPFIVLCRPDLQPFLEGLLSLQTLSWEGEPVSIAKGAWLEYRGCRIPSAPGKVRTRDLTLTEQALLKAIRPTSSGAIRLQGGLQAPDRQGGWLEGCLPRAVVEIHAGFAEVTVLNLQTRQTEPVVRVAANEPLDLPPLSPGFYRIEAAVLPAAGSGERPRPLPPQILSIRTWDSLVCAPLATEPA
jgi:hypothetical protein